MRRKKHRKRVDRELLETLFNVESEWKHFRDISNLSVGTNFEIRDRRQLAEAKYRLLIKEAKHRNLNMLKL